MVKYIIHANNTFVVFLDIIRENKKNKIKATYLSYFFFGDVTGNTHIFSFGLTKDKNCIHLTPLICLQTSKEALNCPLPHQ